MRRCPVPACGGVMLLEPAEDTHIGPPGIKRSQLICLLCARVEGVTETPLPLVHHSRFGPSKRTGMKAWN